ncbi:MAG: polymer-forming cytoskeletal protein [Chloroflexi bacterium]|nr:MAG: polymer-forming cytoskeletal protein [Chloroflexota bacterium]
METQEAVMESAPVETDGQTDAKRDGTKKFTLGPNDSLEGKLTYGGSMTVDGGHAEGEFRIGGNIEIGNGTVVKALLEASNVTIKGEVEGKLTARDKLTLGKSAKLNGDVQVKRLQIEDGATLNGYVRMGDFEQQAGS